MSRLKRIDGKVTMDGRVLPFGPWYLEPDHVSFRSHGLPCILHRNNMGAWCGYVAVPPEHPWHGKDDQEINTNIHGGLTYADRCSGDICHVAEPGEPDDVWWVGFDCIHAGDCSLSEIAQGYARGEYRTAYYAMKETVSLAKQAAKASL